MNSDKKFINLTVDSLFWVDMKKDRLGAIFGKGVIHITNIDFVERDAEVEYANKEGGVSTFSVPYRNVKHIIGKYLDLNGLTKMEGDIEESIEEETLYDSAESGPLGSIMKRIKARTSTTFGKGKQKLSVIDLANLGRYLSYKLNIYISDIRYSDGKVGIEYIDEEQEERVSTFFLPYGNAKSLIAEYQEATQLIAEITLLTAHSGGPTGLYTMPLNVVTELQNYLMSGEINLDQYTQRFVGKARMMSDDELRSMPLGDLKDLKGQIENGVPYESIIVIPKITESEVDEMLVRLDSKAELYGTDLPLEEIITEAQDSVGDFRVSGLEFIPSEFMVPPEMSGLTHDELSRVFGTISAENGILDETYIPELREEIKEDEELRSIRLKEED
ncbi:MAG: hypothetical protein ISS94_03575 [Candidatus Syntrophoarchaeum sp.]|nr:hypothetical protein [Candidatus Syntrophoarchaeum sp.]